MTYKQVKLEGNFSPIEMKSIKLIKRQISCYEVFEETSILQRNKNLARKKTPGICTITKYEKVKFHLIYRHIKNMHIMFSRTSSSLKKQLSSLRLDTKTS